ncbi:MAG: hypothetical protein ACRCT1_06080 [Microcoleaceae cyanobacterium]
MTDLVMAVMSAIGKELGWAATYLPRAGLVKVILPKNYKHDTAFLAFTSKGWIVKPRKFEKRYPAITAFLNRFNSKLVP